MKLEALVNKFSLHVAVASSIESYPKESYGFVLGNKENNKLFIYSTVPSLSAIRYPSYVEIDEEKEKRFLNYIECIYRNAGLKVMGDYHSHTSYRGFKPTTELSGYDIADLKERKNWISFIISIETVQGNRKIYSEIKELEKILKGNGIENIKGLNKFLEKKEELFITNTNSEILVLYRRKHHLIYKLRGAIYYWNGKEQKAERIEKIEIGK